MMTMLVQAQAGVEGYYPPPYGPPVAWATGYDPQQQQQPPPHGHR